MASKDKEKLPKPLQTYAFWGVEFNNRAGDEYIATCPFCQHNDKSTGAGHFYASSISGAFDCKSCGKQGGRKDFIKAIHAYYLFKTTDTHLQKLADLRGIPRIALEGWQIAVNKSKYLIPVLDEDGNFVDLRVYRKGRNEIATKGMGTQLLGGKRLDNLQKKTEPVYLCAGSFDCIYLDWLFKRTNKPGITLAVPGENTWKDDWTLGFEKRNVIVCYDHDDAGYGTLDTETGKCAGSLKVYARLNGIAASVNFTSWPDESKKGFDVSDFINEERKAGTTPTQIYNKLHSYISPRHKYYKNEVKPSANLAFGNEKPKEEIDSFSVLREKFAEMFDLNENFETAIKLALATVLSIQLPGRDPVWMLLVGPPGEGKSVIIESIEGCLQVLWESSLSSKALCSGFGLGQTRADPSILARVHKKCLALKDYTEVLEKNETERNEIFSILRGAYDGRIKRPFGTGVRQYVCEFSMLAGVTNKIQAYSQGSVGERFIRYNIHPVGNSDKKQEAALNMQYTRDTKMDELKAFVQIFLNTEFDVSPERCISMLPDWWRDRIKPLGKIVEWLRTNVERQAFGVRKDTVIYAPVAGSGNRASIQLEKLAMALCFIEGKPRIDEAIYAIIKQVAVDSIESYRTTIAFSILKHSVKGGIDSISLEQMHGVEFVENYIDDLKLLKFVAVKKSLGGGLVIPTKKAQDLFIRARLHE